MYRPVRRSYRDQQSIRRSWLQFFRARAARSTFDHFVFAHGDEGTGQAANAAGGHEDRLFHSVVEGARRCPQAHTHSFQTHFFQNSRNAVTRRVGAPGTVDIPKGTFQAAQKLPGLQAGLRARNRKAVFLIISTLNIEGFTFDAFQGPFDNARAADANADAAVTLGNAVEGAGHKGIIFYRVREDDELGTA